jgi:hypothetical protein
MALSGGARAQDGRVTAPADPAKRCAGIPVPPDVCAAKQKKALARGCITQGEYNALVRYGSFPTCDYDDTPPSFQGWCACGCFDQGVRIMARGDGGEMTWQPAGEVAAHVHSYMLAALSPEAKTTEPAFVEAPIRLATKGAEEQPLYVIGTPYGKGLRLTANHAVLLASGKMVTARELQVGESLVGVRGEAVPILSIDRAMATADVVNFATEEEDHLSHILAAEGVLVGDLLWQSSYADELNAVVLRQ